MFPDLNSAYVAGDAMLHDNVVGIIGMNFGFLRSRRLN
jgi:hypothetical protein